MKATAEQTSCADHQSQPAFLTEEKIKTQTLQLLNCFEKTKTDVFTFNVTKNKKCFFELQKLKNRSLRFFKNCRKRINTGLICQTTIEEKNSTLLHYTLAVVLGVILFSLLALIYYRKNAMMVGDR